MVKLQNVLFVCDYFNHNLPHNFQNTFNLNMDIIQRVHDGRQISLPQWFDDYLFTNPNIQPHEDPMTLVNSMNQIMNLPYIGVSTER